MTPTSEYQFISKHLGSEIVSALAHFTAQGWRPILMSTTTHDGRIQVTILLEKPLGA
jgi:hypothetical protein